MNAKAPQRRVRKKLVALRFSGKTIALIKQLKRKTGCTATRIIEDAVYLHAQDAGCIRRAA